MRALFWLLLCSPLAFAQQADVRYELGKRVHAFEVAWDAVAPDATTKKRVAPVVNQAVQNYFRFNFTGVGQTIDRARHLLRSADDVPATVRWAEALHIVPETRVFEDTAKELRVTVRPFYKVDGEAPPKPSIRLQIGDGTAIEKELPLGETSFNVPTNCTGNATQDTLLRVEIRSAGKALAKHQIVVARIAKLDARIQALEARVGQLPTPRTTIEQATLADHTKLLARLAQRAVQETDYPAARLLAEAEELAQGNTAWFTSKRAGEYWLSVPTGNSITRVRLLVPDKLTDKPVPIVVALHGMGGSENMFFDSYGNGIVPKLAKERGWLVVATRVDGLLGAGPAPAVPALLDELQKRYPIDPKQVFLIGHSMGAGHVLQLTQQKPDRYAAAVALGGGGRIAKADALQAIPFFVGCGQLDFALNGAKALAKSLEGGKVTFKEYEDIEHLVIVREAAPDVFKFLDGLKRSPSHP